jgi:hypothetical protein
MRWAVLTERDRDKPEEIWQQLYAQMMGWA